MSHHVYIVTMKNGKWVTMLTGQCENLAKAEENAKERFGKCLLKVEERSTTAA